MIQIIRDSIFSKCFWGFVALYLLNCSIDAPDFYPDKLPEDLSFNEQESILEVIIEKALGFEDAIDEYDDNDSKNEQVLKKNTLSNYFELVKHSRDKSEHIGTHQKNRFSRYQFPISSTLIEIQSPPPEV